jgi:hypothetical protein
MYLRIFGFVYKGGDCGGKQNGKKKETCEYCHCYLSLWMYWEYYGKKYCSEACQHLDKK